MNPELDKAIKVIEDNGGFVMLPETEAEQREVRKETLSLEKKREEDIQAEIDESKADYESRKKDAFEEFDRALGSKKFSMNMVDDICYKNGIDLDDIEEYIHGHY